jgi:hypothetical protein
MRCILHEPWCGRAIANYRLTLTVESSQLVPSTSADLWLLDDSCKLVISLWAGHAQQFAAFSHMRPQNRRWFPSVWFKGCERLTIMNDEMAERVEARCRQIGRIFKTNWEWGKFYEEFSKDCGLEVEKPEIAGRKDPDNPIRKRFSSAMRKVIRQKDYTLERVTKDKHELVEAILNFER